jgi:LacI family gluconate utilization system Gnt-I transcriptional repressor
MKRRAFQDSELNNRRRATLSDVARRAKVSPVTVSRAIRHPEMVSDELRLRIDDAVRSLNYIPNSLASALASTRTHIVGVIVPSLTNSVFDDYLNAIQDVLRRAGIQMIVLNSRYSASDEEKAIEVLLGYHPEAMIVVGIDQSERSREMLRNSGIPVIQALDLGGTPIDMMVGFDHKAAGAAAVRYLHQQGHSRIAHLTVHTDPRAHRRFTGYKAAMKEFGLSIEGLVGTSPGPSTVQLGGKLLAEVLERAPDATAVFTCNDDLALGALFECQRRGLRVPEDLAIIGFNDLDFCEAAVPQLSSVATERAQAGTWAGKAVIEIIRGGGKRPKNLIVDTGFKIVERASTAPGDAPRAKSKAKAGAKPRTGPRRDRAVA